MMSSLAAKWRELLIANYYVKETNVAQFLLVSHVSVYLCVLRTQ